MTIETNTRLTATIPQNMIPPVILRDSRLPEYAIVVPCHVHNLPTRQQFRKLDGKLWSVWARPGVGEKQMLSDIHAESF